MQVIQAKAELVKCRFSPAASELKQRTWEIKHFNQTILCAKQNKYWAWGSITTQSTGLIFALFKKFTHVPNSKWKDRCHSFIISRKVLILTLSIFNAQKVCISWNSLATGLSSEAIIYKDHNIQYSPCALGSVQRNTSLGTVFPRTLPRESIGNTSSRGNIDNAPAMM